MNRKSLCNERYDINGIIKSVFATISIIVGLCAIVSYLIIAEIIKEEWLTYAGMIVLTLSGICGAEVVRKNTKNRIWLPLIPGITVIILFTIIHMIIVRGPLQNVLEITATILAGNGITILANNVGSRGKKRILVMRSR